MLYFESITKLTADWKGLPIYECSFLIVENGHRLTFRVTEAAREIKKLQLGSCYERMSDIELEYKIAWLKEDNDVKRLPISFSMFRDNYMKEQEEKRQHELVKKKEKKPLFGFKAR